MNEINNTRNSPINQINTVKSPSDTTVYAPALRRMAENHNSQQLMDKISNFVESIRLDVSEKQRNTQESTPVAGPSSQQAQQPTYQEHEPTKQEVARQKS